MRPPPPRTGLWPTAGTLTGARRVSQPHARSPALSRFAAEVWRGADVAMLPLCALFQVSSASSVDLMSAALRTASLLDSTPASKRVARSALSTLLSCARWNPPRCIVVSVELIPFRWSILIISQKGRQTPARCAVVGSATRPKGENLLSIHSSPSISLVFTLPTMLAPHLLSFHARPLVALSAWLFTQSISSSQPNTKQAQNILEQPPQPVDSFYRLFASSLSMDRN